MLYNTKKKNVDDMLIVLTRFAQTDDSRLDYNWLSYKFDQVREQLIIKSFQDDGVVDRTWLSDLSVQTLHSVNYADDPSITYCCSDISKLFIPNIVSLRSREDGNVDLGLFSIMSLCGKTEYTMFPMSIWASIPKEHIRSKFHYYDRINTSLYVNKKVEKLLIRAILSHPEDGYLINSTPVTSGNLVNGTVYVVKGSQIIYNNTPYATNSTFTATATTTFTGNGTVYLNSELQAIVDTQPYPCSGDMARMITLEILTKEFGIEASEITDVENNSVDDTQKAKQL